MKQPHIVILGAGPAGVGAAFQLTRRRLATVTVLERNHSVGGNAGSFELAGFRVDYGSHRLHPSCDPTILQDIRMLLGEDLLDRPRHGRIRMNGRWVHFPLRPLDLLTKISPDFAFGVARDLIRKALRVWERERPEEATFASVLETGLGRTICRDFYFPYAEKLWGIPPVELSVVQARRRVGASSLAKMVGKILSSVPGLKRPTTGRFYYPRLGYGQISEALAQAAGAQGATFKLGTTVTSIQRAGERVQSVSYERHGSTSTLEADHVWSTLPVTATIRFMTPGAPADLLASADRLDYRAMILVYLVLEQDRFSEYDAHYFPEEKFKLTRLSEPKNYSVTGPEGMTVLCAEIPCATSDPEWSMTDGDLREVVCEALARAGIPMLAPIKEVALRKLRFAYPVYRRGYESAFDSLDSYLGRFVNLLTFGRQGLFAHDNTHHALYMAYSAVDCLASGGTFDRAQWKRFRRVFESHVVED